MKNWIISETVGTKTYLIANEKALWISEQAKDTNIDELIASKNLGAFKSIRYEDVKEIIFIDSEGHVEFNYRQESTEDEEFQIDTNTLLEIRDYLKKHLQGVAVKNYSIFSQIMPNLIFLGITLFFTVLVYLAAVDLENGNTISVTGRRSWMKKLLASAAETLGTTGTLIAGISILGILGYILVKKIKQPKSGEVLKISKSARLSLPSK